MNFVSAINHPESPLSGSTIESMISKAKSLDNKYFAVTDNGYFNSVLKAYMYGKKEGVKVIAGVDAYFRDRSCSIIENTPAENIKYYKVVLHAQDQESYQKLAAVCSDFSKKTITVMDNEYALIDWKDLEYFSTLNITVSTSDVEDIVTKNLLINRPDIALECFKKLADLFKNKFHPALITSPYNQSWNKLVRVTTIEGSFDIPLKDRVEIEGESRSYARDLYNRFRSGKECKLTHVYINKFKYPVKPESQKVTKVVILSDFQNIPSGDIQLRANKFIYQVSKAMGLLDNILISNYSYYADHDDKVVQNMRLIEDRQYHQHQYMRSNSEAFEYLSESLGIKEDEFEKLISNTIAWAEKFKDFKFKYDYQLPDVGENPEKQLLSVIKEVGRMKYDDPRYTKQLKEEFELLTQNGVVNLVPYFLPIVDIFKYYNDNNRLTGPARGSAGGFLISYLIGITHIDPIKYDLSSSRFLTLDRINEGGLPDIDSDFEDRELLVGKNGSSGYLYGRYGDKVAQISTRTMLRLKSAILDANRFKNNGEVEDSVAKLSKSLPSTPQGITDKKFVFGYSDTEGVHVDGIFDKNEDLQIYAKERPSEWETVKRALSLARQNGRHPCSYVIGNKPIEKTIPTFKVGGVDRIIQSESKQAEFAGLIKYDFLVVKAIKDNRVCLDYINTKNNDKMKTGYFMHNGVKTFVWDLPYDENVYKMLGDGHTESVFQFNTVSVTPFVKSIKPNSIIDLATITALVRPGPLDYVDQITGRNMAEEYIERKFGRSQGDIKILDEMLPETYGVLIFQEQIVKVAKELGKMSISDAENVRIAMGKKKQELLDSLKPKFIEGAILSVDKETAEKVWSMMETFARYGFNKSHSVAYVVISYACAFFKYHYPLEWWASVLSNADDKEINEVFYKYVKDMVLPPDINISKEAIAVDYNLGKLRNKLSMISKLGNKVAEKIISMRPYTDVLDFVRKNPCGHAMGQKLSIVGALDSLFPDGLSVMQKVRIYTDTMEIVNKEEKITKAQSKIDLEIDDKKKLKLINTLEKLKLTPAKEGKIEDKYMDLHTPLKKFVVQKDIFPTMNLDLDKIIVKSLANFDVLYGSTFPIISLKGEYGSQSWKLMKGEMLQKLEVMVLSPEATAKASGKKDSLYFDFAIAGYVMDAKEFDYAKGTKKALKIVIDSSGYVSEKVIWPNREGVLEYPNTLKKGAVGIFMYSKKAESDYTSLRKVYIEKILKDGIINT
jgi:DNA-directed DNA polymerase III PolC